MIDQTLADIARQPDDTWTVLTYQDGRPDAIHQGLTWAQVCALVIGDDNVQSLE